MREGFRLLPPFLLGGAKRLLGRDARRGFRRDDELLLKRRTERFIEAGMTRGEGNVIIR
jgi:hypothetical protein